MTAIEPGFDQENIMHVNQLSGQVEAAMLTHDIRTSLNGVLGGLCTIDMASLPDDARIQLERVHAASLVLASLVSQAFGEGSDPTAAGILDGYTIFEEFQEFLWKRWRGAAESRSLELIFHVDPGLPAALDCPTVDLSRMIGNLLSNSLRHTEAGAIRVDFLNTRSGGIEITVTDTGPGADEAILRAVAKPDFGDLLRADARRRLGLQIVKSLTNELGGRFSIRNGSHGGLVAAIWLPEKLCIRDRSRIRKPARPGSASFPALTGRRVLLAEDNPTNQMVATQMLDALHAEVTVTADGVEALEAYAAEDFDIVVVDIEMPRLSGLDVIRAIRALPDGRSRVPIVALTAYALQEHRERIERAGANGLISKPIIGIEEFGRALSVHLEGIETDSRQPEPRMGDRPASGEAIDRNIYDTLVIAVGQEMRGELLDRVLADLAGAREDLRTALERVDLKVIRSATHILISVGGAIGASRVLATARSVNSCAHGEDLNELPQGVLGCIRELDAAIAFIEGERQGVVA